MMTTIELIARAMWNESAPHNRLGRANDTSTGGLWSTTYEPVLWDDDDMREADRVLFRAKARAGLGALAENVSDEMADACDQTDPEAKQREDEPFNDWLKRIRKTAIANVLRAALG